MAIPLAKTSMATSLPKIVGRQRLGAAAHVRKPVDETFVLPTAHTGARVSELLALRAIDVDLNAGTVRTAKLNDMQRVFASRVPALVSDA